MKKRECIFLLFLSMVILSEIFLLNQNFALKKRSSAYHHLESLLSQAQSRLNEITYLRSLEGKLVPFLSQPPIVNKTKINFEENDSRFFVMFLFSLNDCAYCLNSEIATWNRFNNLYDDEIFKVIGIVDSVDIKQLRTSMRIKFPVFQIPKLYDDLAEYGVTSTPVVLFADGRSKKILYAHFPKIKDLSDDGFIEKIQMVLDSYKN